MNICFTQRIKNNNQGGVKAPRNNKGETMPKQKLNRLFKKIQKFDVIENDSVIHLFKITHLDNSTAVYDNNGNLVMKSTFNKVFVKNNKEKK
tara:strand:- start:29 stop:304 length:276 start_codon:yes stop_codon:yes gene_type:complete